MQRLGAFELHHIIGEGGMSQVWSGVHVDTAVPVAIKVLTAEVARSRSFASALESEVRAVASLHHPNIVTVLDYGYVPRSEPVPFEAGSPYLVMERATGGTLQQLRRAESWASLRAVLLTLLDALAHAHARNVIHRDLCPRNILISSETDLLPGLKIADFGIAFAYGVTEATGVEDFGIGTPEYMAPEQLRARWRDFGPWTDLYALGLIAYRLASGRAPWPLAAGRILEARISDDRAPLRPEFETPLGFLPWVERLLSQAPRDRYQCAADAAFALAALEPGEVETDKRSAQRAETGADPDTEPRLDRSSPVFDSFDPGHTTQIVTLEGVVAPTVRSSVPNPGAARATPSSLAARFACPGARDTPRIPPTWRHSRSDVTPIRLMGAGLGLYPLRSIPFVNREAERDILWKGLREVELEGTAHAFVMAGPVGSGKSRLSEWTAQRAQEVGAATVLTAVHGRFGSSAQGLGPMVQRHLRCAGAGLEEITLRVEEELRALGATSEEEWCSLVSLVADQTAHRFAQPSERYEALRRFIDRLAKSRLVIVRIEDAQFGSDALGFVRHVLASRAATPVLFLITVETGALGERTVEEEEISEILRSERAELLEVAPLAPDHHRELVRRLLPLEPTLALKTAHRTQGNPLFAVQLIGDWVQRGLLESSAEGFRLCSDPKAVFPRDVRALWSVRIDETLRGQPAAVHGALELAAALGVEVDRREWVEACARLQPAMILTDILDLERKLYASSLAKETDAGFVFSSDQIREAFEHGARRTGQWGVRNRQVTEMLRQQYRTPNADIEERLAHHSYFAGDIEAAIEHHYRAALELFRTSSLARSLAILSEYDSLLTDELWRHQELRARGWLLRARVLLQVGQQGEAGALAARVTSELGEKISLGVHGEALFVRGQVLAHRGLFAEASALYEQAAAMLGGADDVIGEGRCYRELGYAAQQIGELDLAEEHLDLARSLLERTGDQLELAYTLARFGLVARQQGKYSDSSKYFRNAASLFADMKCRFGVAMSLNGIGDALRLQGHLQRAEQLYVESIKRYEAIFAEAAATTPRLNLALLALAQGRHEEAYARAQQAMVAAEAADQRGFLGCAGLIMLPHLALSDRVEEWTARLVRSKQLLLETSFVDIDVAWSAEIAAELARERGWDRDASELLELALISYRSLGMEPMIAEPPTAPVPAP